MTNLIGTELFGPFAEAEAERKRLVRLCLRFTNDADAAEDLAQEALIEAWRHTNELRNPDARRAWMSGIAFNVCRRWARRRGRELSRLTQPMSKDDATELGLDEIIADDFDLEVELERQELAELLDRAMALLPPETRRVLVAKYIMEQPLSEIAAPMGLSEGAIAMRLQRGRLALKQLLSNELVAEAASFGLIDASSDQWQQTRIWCPMCGRGYLRGFLDQQSGVFMMHCAVCSKVPDDNIWEAQAPDFFKDLKGFKAIINRELGWSHKSYKEALVNFSVVCDLCGSQAQLTRGLPAESWLSAHSKYGMHIRCEACGAMCCAALTGYLRGSPEVQRFWQQRPRMRTIAPRPLEVAGRAALLTRYESVTDGAYLDIITDEETFAVLGMYQ